jgi:hypothetical protein
MKTFRLSYPRKARAVGRGDPANPRMVCFVSAPRRLLAMTSFKHTLIAALLGLAPLAALAADPVLPSSDAKKLAERYALTKTRIDELLGARLNPKALPATALPNPFYRSTFSAEVIPQNREIPPQPDAPDLTDADTLAKYAAGLKLSGYLIVGDVPHVSINGAPCKVGDVLTLGPRDHPVFLHIAALSPQEVTLRLNDAKVVLPVMK